MLAPAPLGTVMGEVKNFIMGQPAATHIAVGYIRDNVTVLAQDFTDHHELAAKAIRLPLGTGAIGSSPYLGTMDLLKRWPQTGPRRSIVLISSGIDFFRGRESQIFDPDLDGVIERAQRQNTNIWSVYYPSSGHRFGGSYLLLSYAQRNMGKLAEDTGGESYYLFYQEPVFADFRSERRLQRQICQRQAKDRTARCGFNDTRFVGLGCA